MVKDATEEKTANVKAENEVLKFELIQVKAKLVKAEHGTNGEIMDLKNKLNDFDEPKSEDLKDALKEKNKIVKNLNKKLAKLQNDFQDQKKLMTKIRLRKKMELLSMSL